MKFFNPVSLFVQKYKLHLFLCAYLEIFSLAASYSYFLGLEKNSGKIREVSDHSGKTF